MRFPRIIQTDDEEAFSFIDPPFQFNAKNVAQFAPELTGYHLLNLMVKRLGWPSMRGKKILDYGCGVRFARTIANLDLDLDVYAGVDVNRQAIDWLKQHLSPPKFIFSHLDMNNPVYNPRGLAASEVEFPVFDGVDFDVACMFSVITHLAPDDARHVFAGIRSVATSSTQLYFTAFVDQDRADYWEGNPNKPSAISIYGLGLLNGLLLETGWEPVSVFRPCKLPKWSIVADAK